MAGKKRKGKRTQQGDAVDPGRLMYPSMGVPIIYFIAVGVRGAYRKIRKRNAR